MSYPVLARPVRNDFGRAILRSEIARASSPRILQCLQNLSCHEVSGHQDGRR
ncbi:hypothetical protein Rleg5DRAFT_6539, partial [Rhizobium leguminosarum bv. viciae WSM1455]